MTRPRITALSFVLASFVAVASGCIIEGDLDGDCRGDINVTWSFDGADACPLDTEDVRVMLFDPAGTPLHSPGGDTFACDKGGTTFTQLACGAGYEVRVEAVDDTGTPTWAARTVGVTVINEAVAPVLLDLSEL